MSVIQFREFLLSSNIIYDIRDKAVINHPNTKHLVTVPCITITVYENVPKAIII
jgi:hypothetical protein